MAQELAFVPNGPGIIKVYFYNNRYGGIIRNGKKFEFLPEPFVSFTVEQLEQVLEKVKELNADLPK